MDNQNPVGQIPPIEPQTPVAPSGHKKLIAGLIVGIVVLLGAVVYLLDSRPTGIRSLFNGDQTKNGEQIEEAQTADWQIYKNEDYGFELKYPSEWNINEDIQSDFSTIILGGNKLHVGVSNKSIKDSDICDNSNSKKSTVNIGGQQNSWCIDGNPDDRWVTFANNGTVGVSFYCWFPETQQNIGTCNQILSTFKFTSQSETAGWKIYRSSDWNIEIKYPDAFQLYTSKDSDKIKNLAFIPPCDPFGIVCLFLSPINYPNTNFEGAGISVSTLERYSATDSQCRTAFEGQKKVGDKNFNGFVYTIFEGSGIAAGHFENYRSYRIYYDDLCRNVTLRVTESNISNAPQGSVKQYNQEEVWNKLEQIFNTFKFTTQNETAGWKTYRNEKYQYQLKYPLNLTLDKYSSDENPVFRDSEGKNVFELYTFKSPEPRINIDALLTASQGFGKQITVAGEQAVRTDIDPDSMYKKIGESTGKNSVEFYHSGDAYVISIPGSYWPDLMDNLIQTFEFTN